jgi:NADPH:quinone reductase
MQGFVVSRYRGGLQGSLTSAILPPPGPTEVVVTVCAAALNVADARRMRGASTMGGLLGDYNDCTDTAATLPLPYIAGADGSGVVESVGDEEEAHRLNIHVGDRVQFHVDPCKGSGTFATKAIVQLNSCFRLNDTISLIEAAAMPTSSWAAYIALFDKLRIQPGMTLFVQGGSGGVGHVAVQLAHFHGCRVLSSCSPRNVAFLASLGADVVIDYTQVDVPEAILSATGGVGVDCILDLVGNAADLVKFLRFGGSICSLGPTTLPLPVQLSCRQVSFHFLHLDGLFRSAALVSVFRQVGVETLKLHQLGAFRMFTESLRANQIHQGLSQIATGHTRGKVVVDLTAALAGGTPVFTGHAGHAPN